MPESLEIRAEDAAEPAGQALLAGFRDELVQRYGEFGESRSPSAQPGDFAPPHGRFLVAYLGDEAVACGGIKRLAEGTGELKRMFVASGARGRGISRRLLAALEDSARELGYSRLVLDTGPEQHEAQRLYPSAGYMPIDSYNENPYASLWFEKGLAGG